MEYVYAAMLLHRAGQKVDEASVTKVLTAANITVDDGRVKSLIAALDGVDIEEAIKSAVVSSAAAPAAASAGSDAPAEEKKEEKKEEEKDDTEAAAGLGALFG
ncbi:MAG: 50S ribosomal protein P1 [Candidatus Woesearchaeota archaeon]